MQLRLSRLFQWIKGSSQNKVTSLGRSPNKINNGLHTKSLYGQDSTNTLSRMTRDSFNKKINLKEIVLAESGSYVSSMVSSNWNKNKPFDQKINFIQRESMSRGSIGKPPGTSGGRAPLHFNNDESQQKRYLPVGLTYLLFRNWRESKSNRTEASIQIFVKTTNRSLG